MKALMLLASLITVVPAAHLKGKVVGVESGASVEILSEGKVIRLRLAGIDCPAKAYAAGKAARRFVAERAFMNDVGVEITGTESDGYLIGRVLLPGGMNLGAELVKGGLAWWDMRKSPEEKGLAALEKAAREACLGIWAGANDEDDEDFGKEVLAQRASLVDEDAVFLTRVGDYNPGDGNQTDDYNPAGH
jgi:micrococcal nuclease